MTAIQRAYASNSETPILTLEISHSGLTGGVLRFARSHADLVATLEDSSTVTFSRSGMGLSFPQRSVNGKQDLNFQLDGVSREVLTEVKQVISANRAASEKAICKLRTFTPSDLTAPAEIYTFNVVSDQINNRSAVFRASFAQIPDFYYPRLRYFPSIYPGVKYA